MLCARSASNRKKSSLVLLGIHALESHCAGTGLFLLNIQNKTALHVFGIPYTPCHIRELEEMRKYAIVHYIV
jgi:hypothetical protein